ncbi:MAG: hypothetical protein JRN21_09250 [Nitrososphaerota archaeon]|nr:hypothetical protein [Nitrososphaerota archaeon]
MAAVEAKTIAEKAKPLSEEQIHMTKVATCLLKLADAVFDDWGCDHWSPLVDDDGMPYLEATYQEVT